MRIGAAMNIRQIAISRKHIPYILVFSTLSILLIYTLSTLYLRHSDDMTSEAANRQLMAAKTLALQFGENLRTVIDELVESSYFASTFTHDHETSKSIVQAFFTEYRSSNGSSALAGTNYLVSIRWLDATGEEILTLPLNDDPLSATLPLESSLSASRDTGRPPYEIIGPVPTLDDLPLLWIRVPVTRGEKGELIGSIAAEINLEKLIEHTLQSIHSGTDTGLFIVDAKGKLLYASNHPDYIPTDVLEPDPGCLQCHEEFDLFQSAVALPNGWGFWKNPDHRDLYAFSTIDIGERQWKIALGFPESTISGLVGDFHLPRTVSTMLILCILGLLSLLLVNLYRKRLNVEEQDHCPQHRAAFLKENMEMDQRYLELVEKANDAIYILQGNGFVLVNQAFEDLHGYSREELLSPDFNMMSIVAPEYRDYITERGNRQARGESIEPTYEFQVIRKDGVKVDVEASVTYIQYNGKPAVQGVLRDISERKRRDEQKELMLALSNSIRDSRELDELAKNSLECVTKILEMPIGAFYIYNERLNELRLIAHRGFREGLLSIQERYVVREGEPGIAVQTALRKDIIIVDDLGTTDLLSYIEDRSSLAGKSLISMPLLSQNIFLGVIQLAQDQPDANWQTDITNLKQIASAIALGLHRRQISNELAESEKRLKHFFENSKEIIFIASADGDLTYLNKTGTEIFGSVQADDSVGINVFDHWKTNKERAEYIRELREKGFVRNMEVEYLARDGEMHSFLESSVAMLDEDGQIIEIQGSMTDITSLKKAKEEMRQKNIELERVNVELRELDQMKDNFIATISHELRTPLTSIKGSIDILLKGLLGELDEKKTEILSICRRNSTRLIDLVNDLLEIQHLESSHTKLELRPLEIEVLIPDLVEKATNNCPKKGIDFETRIHTNDQDRIILGDPAMISHAMSNLLSNAIKFSDRGTISIEVVYHDGEVHLSVADEGIGIPDEMREKIFDKFTQVDGSMTRAQGGTGLGLALARTIVEKHGGRIWVESGSGSGSKFTFSLPCYPKNEDTVLPI